MTEPAAPFPTPASPGVPEQRTLGIVVLILTALVTLQAIAGAIWNFWAPYRYMKDATQGFAVRHLGLWWATWLVGTLIFWGSSSYESVDGVTAETHLPVSAPLNAIALTVSWVVLARIIWTVSQGSNSDT